MGNRYGIKKRIVISIVFTGLFIILTSCSISNSMDDSDEKLQNRFKKTSDEPQIMPEKMSNINVSNPKIIIEKSIRKLKLMDGETVVATFSIGLGFTPEGHKQEEGDGKTPEGEYYVCVKNPNSRYHLSLGVSYPNKEDAKNGLVDGRIDEVICNKIVQAIDENERPPWNTPLGGEIMIHGSGASDWTAGCIAVDDDVMDWLYEICDVGTPIEILP